MNKSYFSFYQSCEYQNMVGLDTSNFSNIKLLKEIEVCRRNQHKFLNVKTGEYYNRELRLIVSEKKQISIVF